MGGVIKTQYAVVDFLEWQRQASLDLRPYYQRRSVWNPRVKSLLVDSLIRGFPLPLIFLHNRLDVETSKSVRQVVDGQQRLRTILAFIDLDCLGDVEEWDHFALLKSHNSEFGGKPFGSLPSEIQTMILQTQLSVNVLPADVRDVTLLQMFQRMNSTGLKLTPQEIRNATYFGEFKDLSYELAYEQYQKWLSWGLFTQQDVAQMKEVEFTADLLGLLMRGVAAGTRSTINNLYKNNEAGPVLQRQELEEAFRQACEVLDGVLGDRTPKTSLRRFRTTAWVYAMFAVVTAADRFDVLGQARSTGSVVEPLGREDLQVQLREAEAILSGAKGMDESLLKVLRGATGDRASREKRIGFLRSPQHD